MDYTFIWDTHPELPFLRQLVPIRYYSLLFSGGLMAAYLVVKHLYKKEGLSITDIDTLALYIFSGTIIGARLGHCLFYEPTYYLSHPIEMFLPIRMTTEGVAFTGYQGLASHGATIGIFLSIVSYSYQYKTALFPILDKIAIVAALGGGFIRVGNFMNSEIIGIPTHANYGIIFKNIDNIPRHPAQLYEAVCYFLIFASLYTIYKYKRDQYKSGYIFGLFLVILFSARIGLEFIKINQVAFEEGMYLNMGQLLSLPMILLGFFVMIFRK